MSWHIVNDIMLSLWVTFSLYEANFVNCEIVHHTMQNLHHCKRKVLLGRAKIFTDLKFLCHDDPIFTAHPIVVRRL